MILKEQKKESKLLKKARSMVERADEQLQKVKRRREILMVESKVYTKVIT